MGSAGSKKDSLSAGASIPRGIHHRPPGTLGGDPVNERRH